MTLSSIRQNIENIDYAWNKPQTYLVFVPGISLLIQKIQLAKTLPLFGSGRVNPNNVVEANAKTHRFDNICKWHLRGSLTQIVTCAIIIQVFTLPVFSFLAILATYELVDTLVKSLTNSLAYYEFYPNGSFKRVVFGSACHI